MSLQFVRCGDCGLIHFSCALCAATRTIQKEAEKLGDYVLLAEPDAIGVLRLRAEFSGIDQLICDRCWPAVRDRKVPKINPNGYVKPPPKLFIMG